VRTAAQRHVDELNKQKESVAAHLTQISQLLGGQMPGIADALKPKPAVQAQAPRAVAAPPSGNGGNGGNGAPQAAAPKAPPTAQQAAPAAPPRTSEVPAGQHAAPGRPDSQPSAGAGVAKQSANAKSGGKGDDDEWWTE
jgi:hypothetical protein